MNKNVAAHVYSTHMPFDTAPRSILFTAIRAFQPSLGIAANLLSSISASASLHQHGDSARPAPRAPFSLCLHSVLRLRQRSTAVKHAFILRPERCVSPLAAQYCYEARLQDNRHTDCLISDSIAPCRATPLLFENWENGGDRTNTYKVKYSDKFLN